MSRKPKSIREVYTESMSINIPSLRKDMLDRNLDYDEVQRVLVSVSELYNKRLDQIESDCQADPMVLEFVPSPLELLIECMSKIRAGQGISSGASDYLGKFASAWESWM